MSTQTAAAIDLGTRLEPLVDTFLIDQLRGEARQLVHPPALRELSLFTDEPWEGNACSYCSVFWDGDRCRMYYGTYQNELGDGSSSPRHNGYLCYAESRDGIRWTKPTLGLVSFAGSIQNNILFATSEVGGVELDAAHTAVFRDENPACPADARYKVIIRGKPLGLYVLQSADGIHFTLAGSSPILTQGYFDSQNLAFWDGVRGEYRAYFRDFRGGHPSGVRDIMTATSTDFKHWSEPVWLSYPGAPTEQLYTNQVLPYARAPHLFFGFPMRYVDRGWIPQTDHLPGLEERKRRASVSPRYGSAITDGLFMSSRDGLHFHRWGEALIRPGLRPTTNWVYGDNCTAWGIVETASEHAGAPPELSIYATEGYWRGTGHGIRRYSLRMDGFVSVQAPLVGGELWSKPLVCSGRRLLLNCATSAGGSIRVELQDAAGQPIPGYSMADAVEIYGDSLEQPLLWKQGDDLGALAGQPIRLRCLLKDADIYALRFQP